MGQQISTLGLTHIEEYVRCLGVRAYPWGDNDVLICSERNGSREILSRRDYEILNSCGNFATLENHALNFHNFEQNRKLPQGRLKSILAKKLLKEYGPGAENIKDQLAHFIDMGFLVKYSEISNSLLSQSSHRTNRSSENSIKTVGFVTRDRVDSLKRALSSYIENTKQHARSNDFVVMDGSSCEENQTRCIEMLKSLKTHYDVDIYYGGQKERQHFSNLLINEGVLPEVIHFALFDVEGCGYAPGINRNALLLHNIGDAFFSADDDTVCKVASTSNHKHGFAFTQGDPTQIDFYPDRKGVLRDVSFIDEDILGLHERMLGKGLGECMSEFCIEGELIFENMNNQFLNRMLDDQSRVLVTLNGWIGDCGWGSSNYLWLNQKSHEKLVESASSYLSGCTSREVIRSVSFPTISDATFCMSTFIGLDNRQLLPPFMPVLRDQDGIFGATLWRCFESGHLGYLPWALVHSPMQHRAFTRKDISKLGPLLRANEIIKHLVFSFEPYCSGLGPVKNLRLLGKKMMGLSNMDLAEFKTFIYGQICEMASRRIAFLDYRLKLFSESPKYWADDARRYLTNVGKAMQDKEILFDSVGNYHGDQGVELLQRLVFRFGQLLYWWPDICEATRSLKDKGVRLGTRLSC